MRKKILFVGHTTRLERPYIDPSTRYRCFVPAAALRHRGHDTAVVTQKMFEDRLSDFSEYDCYMFHRPTLTPALSDFLEQHKHSRRLIADFDDFIFDVSITPILPSCRFGTSTLTSVARYVANNAAACRYFSQFSASTAPLIDKMRDIFDSNKNVVISNALEASYIGLSSLIRSELYKVQTSRPYRFGYFSGTATHNEDFNMIASALRAEFERDSHWQMLILGPVKLPAELEAFHNRIERVTQTVSFNQLPYVMAQVETVLAPLEWNDFTLCKSGLKFFEAALVGCRAIATPIPDIDRFSSPLLRKCATVGEWEEALAEQVDFDCDLIEAEVDKIIAQIASDTVAATWEKEFLS